MPYCIEAIEAEWLNGSAVDCEPGDLVRGFDEAERLLGAAWIESIHNPTGSSGAVTGSHPTLSVASAGWRLAALAGVPGSDQLIARLIQRDASAWSELDALYLCLGGETRRGSAELGPLVKVGGGERRPDLRLRLADSPWAYVEVTAPIPSKDAERVQQSMQRIGGLLADIPLGMAVEVFLSRAPDAIDIDLVFREVKSMATSTPPVELVLPGGLGRIFSHGGDPSVVTVDDHGEDHVPRLAMANVRMEAGRHANLVVRVPFEDRRAEQILTTEARQLPQGAPSIVIVDMNDAAGGWNAWEGLISRRFQPTIHTRISGVVLFMSGVEPGRAGERLQFYAKVVNNPHASAAMPQWIQDNLASFPAALT